MAGRSDRVIVMLMKLPVMATLPCVADGAIGVRNQPQAAMGATTVRCVSRVLSSMEAILVTLTTSPAAQASAVPAAEPSQQVSLLCRITA